MWLLGFFILWYVFNKLIRKVLEQSKAPRIPSALQYIDPRIGELSPIPSSAQLVREWHEVCACGHLNAQHHPPSKSCMGLHETKPCVCPGFYA